MASVFQANRLNHLRLRDTPAFLVPLWAWPLGDSHGAALVAWQSTPDIDCWSDPIHFARLPFSVPKRRRFVPLPLGHLLRHNRVAACRHSV